MNKNFLFSGKKYKVTSSWQASFPFQGFWLYINNSTKNQLIQFNYFRLISSHNSENVGNVQTKPRISRWILEYTSQSSRIITLLQRHCDMLNKFHEYCRKHLWFKILHLFGTICCAKNIVNFSGKSSPLLLILYAAPVYLSGGSSLTFSVRKEF